MKLFKGAVQFSIGRSKIKRYRVFQVSVWDTDKNGFFCFEVYWIGKMPRVYCCFSEYEGMKQIGEIPYYINPKLKNEPCHSNFL